MDKIGSKDLELAPFRRLEDFLLSEARFQIPNVKDVEKWGNRVVNNLLYYQTNYFFLAICIFLVVGYLHPLKILMGSLAMSVLLAIFAYFSMEGSAVHNFKRKYPIISVICLIFGGCFFAYYLESMLVFLCGILLPFCVVFVHASLRLRSYKNKIVNKFESIGLRRTPMGLFLECFGMEPEVFT